MNAALIAPCGMNCALCIGYLRDKNKCPGCRKTDAYKSSYGRECYIRSCQVLQNNNWEFCSGTCEKYPCQRLRNLDKRYRTKYGMSMIENLENIKHLGIEKFIESEHLKWKCPECNKLICVHRNFCLFCGSKKNERQ